MPLFSSKFSAKKTPPRKSNSVSTLYRELDARQLREEFGLDYGAISLKMGNKEFNFNEATGAWEDSQGCEASNGEERRAVNQQLADENRLLKLKIEILTEMVG